MQELIALTVHHQLGTEQYEEGESGVSSITSHYLETTEDGVEESAAGFVVLYDDGRMTTWNKNNLVGYTEYMGQNKCK